ncbi:MULTISPECIES: hypothetical protein [unclassified Ekhidna]|jgi:hypothetical protein|uniref:hypothetical protein n=1 Tax=unclassified Ekhidna TaxID=2632188 RepID=UPI0032DF63C1
MKVIWFNTVSHKYLYSSKQDFDLLCNSIGIRNKIVKVEELNDIPNYIMDQLVDEMNKHNTQPVHQKFHS